MQWGAGGIGFVFIPFWAGFTAQCHWSKWLKCLRLVLHLVEGGGGALGYTLGRDTNCPKVGVFVISLSQVGAIRNITLREKTIYYCHIRNSLFFVMVPRDTAYCELPTDKWTRTVLYFNSRVARWRAEVIYDSSYLAILSEDLGMGPVIVSQVRFRVRIREDERDPNVCAFCLAECAKHYWKRLQDNITDKTQVSVCATETKRWTQHISFPVCKPSARHSEGDVDCCIRFQRYCALWVRTARSNCKPACF
jgi:hypothetical protein